MSHLIYGDNLNVLRHMESETIDLIYLDPPFNSARNYNLMFKQHKGQDSPAQIMTFDDPWSYSPLLMQNSKSDGRNSELFKLEDS
jgi:DNA modification methylase